MKMNNGKKPLPKWMSKKKVIEASQHRRRGQGFLETFDCTSPVGLITLVKGIPPEGFSDWLHRSELSLHRSE